MGPVNRPITPDCFDAVLFDLDGVLTSTASAVFLLLGGRGPRPGGVGGEGAVPFTGCAHLAQRAPHSSLRPQWLEIAIQSAKNRTGQRLPDIYPSAWSGRPGPVAAPLLTGKVP
jgi:hypothetical protein